MMQRVFLPLVSILLLLVACDDAETTERKGIFFRSWAEIEQSDTLRIVTMTSPQDFYLYRGEIMGQEYQKVVDFAEAHQVALDIHIAKSTDSLLAWLSEGRVDLCITPIPMTKANTDAFDFGGIVDTTSLVLVQKKGEMVNTLSEIAGKEVWVEYGGAGELRLRQIEEEIGLPIRKIVPDTLGIEEILVLMSQVDSIKYAIASEDIARGVLRYFPSLDGSLLVSAPIRYSWAVAKGNHELADKLDDYLLSPQKQRHYSELKKQNSHLTQFILADEKKPIRVVLEKGAISSYDEIFKKYAKRTPWDWTLLAAIAYHESTFRSDVVAWSGARGLMGIMPGTGRAHGTTVDQLLVPEVSVRVSVDVLMDTYKYFADIKDAHQKLCFTLAGYNAGAGHVQDAIRLARKYNAPDTIWNGGVREFILLKSNPEYYNDDVVRNGYLRGRETSDYVDEVLERKAAYDALLNRK